MADSTPLPVLLSQVHNTNLHLYLMTEDERGVMFSSASSIVLDLHTFVLVPMSACLLSTFHTPKTWHSYQVALNVLYVQTPESMGVTKRRLKSYLLQKNLN